MTNAQAALLAASQQRHSIRDEADNTRRTLMVAADYKRWLDDRDAADMRKLRGEPEEPTR